MEAESSAPIVRRHRRTAWTAAALLVGHQLGEAAVPVVIGATIDRAIVTGDGAAMVRWMGALVASFAFLSFSYRFGSRFSQSAVRDVDHDVRLRITARLVDRRGIVGRFGHRGQLLSLATSDSLIIGLSGSLPGIILAALGPLLVAGVALFAMSLWLGLLVVVGSAVLLAVTSVIGNHIDRRATTEQEGAAHATAVATDIVTAMRVIHGLGAQRAAARRYTDASQTFLRSTIHTSKALAATDGVTTLLTGVFLAVIALVGARLAESGSITIGQLIAAFGLAQFLIGPWSRLADVTSYVGRVRASRRRVDDVLAAPIELSSGDGHSSSRVDATAPVVELRGVRHGSLRDLDLTIPADGLTAIVTADPADADAVAELLARHRDPDDGDAMLEGATMRLLDPHTIDRRVLGSPRRADVFGGNLFDNVRRPAASDASAHAAIRAAAADEILDAVAARDDGDITEHGRSLSGGQRQRVALARALATDRAVIVLVEPTSNVDSVTESTIVQRVRALRAGRATVVLTSSPAWLGAAQQVVVIVDGRTVATGAHDDLIRDDARYASLVTA